MSDSISDRFLEIAETATIEHKRVMLFLACAVRDGVWPEEYFQSLPLSETDEQCDEKFFNCIQRVPQADRLRIWAEVDSVFAASSRSS